MAKNEELSVVLPEDVNLDDRELTAYKYWCSKTTPAISPSTQVQFFQLYLNGKSCEEIRRLNPGFDLGSIVAAKVKGKWDNEREKYLSELFIKARQRVQQTTLETAELLCDLLTAKNKYFRDKILKYIQTGNEAELQDLKFNDLKGYKEISEALMKITGQDQKRQVTGSVDLNIGTPKAAASVTPTQATEILAALRMHAEGNNKV